MDSSAQHSDVLIIGAGIIGATTAALLAQLQPQWSIRLVEALDRPGLESSYGWHNAGTGHAGLCEFNYTPTAADGSIDPAAALRVHEQFLASGQYWAHLASTGRIKEPGAFIRSAPHFSFAQNEEWVQVLRERHRALSAHPLFAEMEFSQDPDQLSNWLPLMFESRADSRTRAATRSRYGTDVDYGALSVLLAEDAQAHGVQIDYSTRVHGLSRRSSGGWNVSMSTGENLTASFVFVAAGGGTLPLLQNAEVEEVEQMGGFPISGQFLRTSNPQLVARHRAKVYSHPAPGAPPLSMPHLDYRVVEGTEYLMFGPFGAFSPKFLKGGSPWDLPGSVTTKNVATLLQAAKNGTQMLKFFVSELLRTNKSRLKELGNFIPEVHPGDWELITAGQRVQMIKRIDGQGRIAGFGTQVVLNERKTLAAVLGASPGASASVSVVLDLLAESFPQQFDGWIHALRKDMPHLYQPLNEQPEALKQVRSEMGAALQLDW